MTRPTISGIAPFFIVADVPATVSFYRDMLGFEITFGGPTPDDEFFGIVRRDGVMIMFKALGEVSDGKELVVEPVPNYNRKPAFSWDAYLEVPDPDALAAEFAPRGVRFSVPLGDDDDGLKRLRDRGHRWLWVVFRSSSCMSHRMHDPGESPNTRLARSAEEPGPSTAGPCPDSMGASITVKDAVKQLEARQRERRVRNRTVSFKPCARMTPKIH